MAGQNPSYFQSAPVNQEMIQAKEVLFHFYILQHNENQANANQRVIVSPGPHAFGCIAVNDWHIRDGPSINDKIVARAQGFHLGAGMTYEDWLLCFNIVFTEERFKASSLKVLGNIQRHSQGEWAIVGGTGEFAFAQGTVQYSQTEISGGNEGNYKELHIRAMCLTFSKPPVPSTPVTKIGPWGGNGGKEFDIPERAPQRLESVTISSGVVIDSIGFSYVDPAEKRKIVGPWGGDGELTDTIKFAPSEIVKEVSGTTGTIEGNNVVTSLTFVTNVRTYGPFGNTKGTAFSVPLMDTDVVGFFARAGEHVYALGSLCAPIYTKLVQDTAYEYYYLCFKI